MLRAVLMTIILIEPIFCIKGTTIDISLCLNTTDFAAIVKCPAFVDKTLLIERIFDSDEKITLITAPRGFGKSTNLNMIKRFVEIVSNENTVKSTENYNLFTANHLKICTETSTFDRLFGKYPVVSIDYKPLRDINSAEECFNAFRILLVQLYLDHKYLLQSEELSWNDKDKIMKYTEPSLNEMLEFPDLLVGFKLLTAFLWKHFQKKVVILIDEFDAYMDSLIFNNNTESALIIKFISNINYHLLKPNEYMYRTILTGVFQIKTLSVLKKLIHHRWLDNNHPFSIYYGITESDVNELLNKFIPNHVDREKSKSEAKIYYNGYRPLQQNTTIYSYSFIWYLLNKTEPSDLFSSRRDYLRRFVPIFGLNEIMGKLQLLVLGEQIIQNLNVRSIIPEYIKELKNMLTLESLTHEQTSLFFYFLHEHGYLTMSFKDYNQDDLSSAENSYHKKSKVKIPNHETKLLFIHILEEIYINQTNVLQNDIDTVNYVVNSFSESTMSNKLFEDFCENFNGLIRRSDFKIKNSYNLLCLLFVLFKPTFITNEIEVYNSKLHERDNAEVLLTNDHGILIVIGTEIVSSENRMLREKAAFSAHKRLINKNDINCLDRNYQNKTVYLGIGCDSSGTISVAYSYSFKTGNNFNYTSVVS